MEANNKQREFRGQYSSGSSGPSVVRLHLQRRFNERLKLNGSRIIVALVFERIRTFVGHAKKKKKEVLVRLICSWAHWFVSSFLPPAKDTNAVPRKPLPQDGGEVKDWGWGWEEQRCQDVNTHTCAHWQEHTHTHTLLHSSRSIIYPSAHAKDPNCCQPPPPERPPPLESLSFNWGNYICIGLSCLH